MKISSNDFHYICDMIKKDSGICLTEDKEYLVESRLLPVLKKHEFEDYSALVNNLKSSLNKDLHKEIVESLTTNETSFFRDMKPFDLLRDEIIPELAKSTSNTIRVWSAACSSGQETYSIAITLLEHKAGLVKPFEISGTDIDSNVLAKAREGVYSQFDVQRGLPITTLIKYFTQEEEKWRLNDDVKSLVSFSELNLMEHIPASFSQFNLVFLRNVLIYFDEQTKKMVLEKVAKQMAPNSFIMLGSAENPLDFTDVFEKYNKINGLFFKK